MGVLLTAFLYNLLQGIGLTQIVAGADARCLLNQVGHTARRKFRLFSKFRLFEVCLVNKKKSCIFYRNEISQALRSASLASWRKKKIQIFFHVVIRILFLKLLECMAPGGTVIVSM